MQYFLAKTDPQTYSIQDFAKEKETVWDGVHSYAALIHIRAMKPGDKVLVYHSQGEASIVGLAEVTSMPREDTGPRPSWVVDMRFIRIFDTPVTLKEIKQSGKFNDWALVKQGRLSTMPVPEIVITWLRSKKIPLE